MIVSKTFSERFCKTPLGKRKRKLCWHNSTIFMSVVLTSFIKKSLLITTFKDLFLLGA